MSAATTDGPSAIPAYDPNHASHGIEYFLRDKTIGPLTGLSIRFAELQLNEEPYKFPEYLQRKLFYGMAACYILRGENEMLDVIMKDEHNPLDPDVISELEGMVCDPSPSDQNRFVVLIHDDAQLKKERLDVVRDLKVQRRTQSARERSMLAGYARQKQEELRVKHEHRLYNALRRGLGISLAQGRLNAAMKYAGELKGFPNRENYEHFGHTRAVIDYLENDGARIMRQRAGFRLGTNPHYWRIQWGPDECPGPLRNYLHQIKLDLEVNWASNLAYSAIGGAVTGGVIWLLNHSVTVQQAAKQLEMLGR